MSIPIWGGEQTVVINRNEGQFEEANGVYYCYKGGLMMTFTSGLNNPNYLVEHQQVYFEVRSVNQSYIIKKIVFHCVDNTTSDNLDCFYWGPSTISIVQNFYNQSAPGTYTYSGYTGTWVGETNKIQFTTMAKPVRFGSVEITYEKETGDIYDLVTSYSQLHSDSMYVIVNQDHNMAMSTALQTSFSQNTMDAVGIEFVDESKMKVKINPDVQIFTLKRSDNVTNHPWLLQLTGSNNYLRRHSDIKGTYNYNTGYALYYEGLNSTYSPVNIAIGDTDDPFARIRFKRSSMISDTNSDTTAISYVNSYTYFRSVAYSSWNTYENSQRVYLYMPARNYEITTECDPTAGGFITLGDGVLELNGHQTSQQYETVTFFVGTNEGYGIGAVTATDANGHPVALTCTSESALGNNYTFTMPAADVHIVATFVDPYEIHTVCTPEYGGEFTFNSGAIDMSSKIISNEGKTVNFTVTASLGYVFTGLTGTDDATGEALTLTDNGDGSYSFVMPGNDVTLSATFDRVIGDIFELVTSTSQIQEDNTYIIVSQYHDKVMKHWNKTETTFLGTPIVEWITSDKSKVRVDDNACFFRLDNLVINESNSYRTADMNTLVGYLGYSGVNVVSTPDQSGYNRATMYVSAQANAYNYLCGFDSIGNNYLKIRYEEGTNSFKIISYNHSTDERVWLYKLVDTYHNISTVCNPPEGGSINTGGKTSAQEGETVTFSVTTNEGYTLDGVTVTYTDGSEGTITVTQNQDGTYSFVMPDDAVTITANFTEVIDDLYLLGTALGKTWAPTGPKFNYDSQKQEYYLDVYFKGVRQGLNWSDGDDRYGYFSLTTRVDDSNWDNIADYRLYPNSNDELIAEGDDPHAVSRNYSSNAFKILAGIYRITVNKAKTQVTVTNTPVTLTLDPESGANVLKGDTVTWTSDVEAKVHAIVALYDGLTEDHVTNDYNLNNTGKVIGEEAVLTETGTNTVTADAWIGYIEATATGTYTVPEGLYLVGWHNGASTFDLYGTPMDYDRASDTYSIKVYYKGVRQNREFTEGDLLKGYFHFSTIQDNRADNDEVRYHYLLAMHNDYPVTYYYDGESPVEHDLKHFVSGDTTNAFEIDPGVYTIYVNGDKDKMWVKKHPLTLDLDLPGGATTSEPVYVTYGTAVRATSDVQTEVHAINDGEVDATYYLTKTLAGSVTPYATVEGSVTTITEPGTTAVTGHAYIGWIEPTNTNWYRYTPLNYLEGDKQNDELDHYQVVCDTLVATWAARGMLWCKDLGNKSNHATYPTTIATLDGNQEQSLQRDYNVECGLQDTTWDQSNWVVLDLTQYLSTVYGLDVNNENHWAEIDELMSQYVNTFITPLAIKGDYTYEDGMYQIHMSSEPTPLMATSGYPGFLRDPHETCGELYCYNHYTPSNFLCYIYPNGQHPGENASQADKTSTQNNFFFVNPKVTEVVHVWGVWLGNDQFVVYQHSSKANRYDLDGKFRVYSWYYNRLDKDSDTAPNYGDPNDMLESQLRQNYDYDFHVAVISTANTPALRKAPRRVDDQQPMGEGKDYQFDGDESFMVLPLDLMGHDSAFTAVEEMSADREVESVRYYNVMGMESHEPFQGINIVVIRYNDGSAHVTKVLR